MTTTRHAVKSGAATAAAALAVLVMLTACASLAIKPCDTIPDRDGTTPLEHARASGYDEIAAILERAG